VSLGHLGVAATNISMKSGKKINNITFYCIYIILLSILSIHMY
jgi:hypothetical protein